MTTPRSSAARPPREGRNPRRGARVSPLYHQVYVVLREQLLSGAHDSLQPLPSEPALAERFAVSRITIRKTLEHLEREGLVRRVRGVGTFPTRRATAGARENISGYLDNLISYEKTTTADMLAWEEAEPSPHVAAALGTDRCLKIVRLRRYQGRPISFTTLHVPPGVAAKLDPVAAEGIPIIEAIERAGIQAERTDQAITAIPAAETVAEKLGVPVGSPLICMRRLMRDGDHQPVLHQESLYAPDQFEYRMSLTRTSIGSVARWTPIA